MFHDFMVLGGAGLVGTQVCRQIANSLSPRRIVVASLLEREAREACRRLQKEFGERIGFVPAWGNLFVPTDLAQLSRSAIMENNELRRSLLGFLYGDFEKAYQNNHLVTMIRHHRPDVIIDCVNTATGLSYQNVFDGATKVMNWLDDEKFDDKGVVDLETFLLSQSSPQIIRHTRLLHRATTEYQTRAYLKVGTTGTGGMGMNIPYTHSEDKPSKVLLAKTEAAFGHTGLMFLLARTPNAPVVKEIKPAAMIGYRAVRTIAAKDRHGNNHLFEPKEVPIKKQLELREGQDAYSTAGSLNVAVVDTGENGVFTRGEFAAITALGQMEYITPEEIARVVVREIVGANTGQDVLSAMDGAVLNPSYKAGLLRSVALSDLKDVDESSEFPSIALGRLGPPELSKLLFEAQLLKESFGSLSNVIRDGEKNRTAEQLSKSLADQLASSKVRSIAPSIGIPILMADGKTLIRGPRINVPEQKGHKTTVSINTPNKVDQWADKGWIDLRAQNMTRWLDRVQKMVAARIELRDVGSAAASTRSYLPTSFEIGEVVAWIFNNEMGGYRVK
jgi:hypothetical protein